MSLRINQNVMAIGAYSSVSQTSSRLEKSIQKLSSGLRINQAADDAAGLAISEKMRRQIRGLSRSVLNAQDAISMVQTAEGALNESHSILQRMRELAIQSSNDTLTSNDRLEIQKEVVQLRDDLNRISRNTEFNTKKLLDGSQTALISASSSSVKGLVTGGLQGGGDFDVDLSLLRGGIAEMQRSQIFTLRDGSGTLASGGTQLQSIAQFYDANGVFVLDTPQAMTLSGNGNSATVNLDGQMTLDNLAADIQNALVSKSGLGIQNSKVATINTIQTQVAGLGGYLQFISGSIGSSGRVSFSADQKVADALGVGIAREAIDSRVQVELKDNFGNVRKVTTEGAVANSILNGVDLKFVSQAAQVAGSQGLEQGLQITGAAAAFTISAGGSQVVITVASGLWSMEGLARLIQSGIDGNIDGLNASVVEGELRVSYERPASVSATVASTVVIANVVSQAATLGFVAGTYSGFTDGRKDLSVAEWGFSRYMATAAGDITLTLGDGTANPAIDLTISLATSVTTSDMVSFIEFQASANSLFDTGSVAIRVDQVGGALAFTSTRIGNENRDNAAAFTSMVSLSMAGAAADQSYINNNLGLWSGTSKGTGDSNFRLRVVDNMPQFQLGADQGQVMRVSIGNMSAEALGVDDIDLTSPARASEALAKLNKAIDKVSAERSKLGSYQNRLEYSINNLRNTHSNLSSAESRIRDADIAMEMIEFTRNQIISQSGTAMLAQANMLPQGVLQLLG